MRTFEVVRERTQPSMCSTSSNLGSSKVSTQNTIRENVRRLKVRRKVGLFVIMENETMYCQNQIGVNAQTPKRKKASANQLESKIWGSQVCYIVENLVIRQTRERKARLKFRYHIVTGLVSAICGKNV